MISIYTSENNKLIELEEFQQDVWVNMLNPTKKEIENLASFYDIPEDFLHAPLDTEERSRFEIEDGVQLILVDFPIYERDINADATNSYYTIPFGIIVTDRCMVTVCTNKSPLVQGFLDGKIKGFSPKKRSRFVLQILYKISTLYLNYLRIIDIRSNDLEKELHKSLKNKDLLQLRELEKSLIYFTTSLKANEAVLERLLRMDFIRRYPDDEDLLEDVIIENKQAIEMANIYSNILTGTMDAFGTIISNNLNAVMKFLASITIILTVPTMIASFYGMNVSLPFSDGPHAFSFILAGAAIIMILLTLILWKKKLF